MNAKMRRGVGGEGAVWEERDDIRSNLLLQCGDVKYSSSPCRPLTATSASTSKLER